MRKKISFMRVGLTFVVLAFFSCSIADSGDNELKSSSTVESGKVRLLLGVKENGRSLSEVIAGIEKGINSIPSVKSRSISSIGLESVHSTRQLVESSRSIMNDNLMPEDEALDYAYKNMETEEEKAIYRDFKFQVDADIADEVMKLIERNDDVAYVQEDNLNVLYDNPNDPHYQNGNLWGLTKTKCGSAWDVTKGESVTVAVIDSGVEGNHPDLVGNFWTSPAGTWGYDFSDNDNYPTPTGSSHGTHVAGTIGAVGNNGIGVVGVAPKVKIMALKIFPNAFSSVCANAIRYAVDNGAKVLNNSWGPSIRQSSNPTIENAINYAHSKGAIVIFAAGNENDDAGYYYGGNSPNTICVAAVDSSFRRASFSNYGSVVDIAAPGVSIKSTVLNAGYSNKSGTSMAAPHVAGLAALILSRNPGYTYDQVLNKMKTTAMPANSSNIGAGVMDAYEAVKDDIPDDKPTMPENFKASNITETSFNLSWDASYDKIGVTGYKIYENGSYVKTVTVLYTDLTGLTKNTSYQVSVSAINNVGKESDKNSITVKTKDVLNPDDWDSLKIYLKGDEVNHNGLRYRAKWWTQGEEPGTTGEWGVWLLLN